MTWRTDWRCWRQRRQPGFRKGGFIAWGLSNGTWTTTQLAQRAKAQGYEWLALEVDDYGNAARWPDFRDKCNAHGIIAGVWVTDGWNLPMTPPDARFVIAELESAGDYDGIRAHPTPTIPHAVVTNFSPFWDHGRDPQPLIQAGWFCQTEAYLGDNPNATPPNLHVAARNFGWTSSQPVAGVYNAPLSTYSQWESWPMAYYVVENVL